MYNTFIHEIVSHMSSEIDSRIDTSTNVDVFVPFKDRSHSLGALIEYTLLMGQSESEQLNGALVVSITSTYEKGAGITYIENVNDSITIFDRKYNPIAFVIHDETELYLLKKKGEQWSIKLDEDEDVDADAAQTMYSRAVLIALQKNAGETTDVATLNIEEMKRQYNWYELEIKKELQGYEKFHKRFVHEYVYRIHRGERIQLRTFVNRCKTFLHTVGAEHAQQYLPRGIMKWHNTLAPIMGERRPVPVAQSRGSSEDVPAETDLLQLMIPVAPVMAELDKMFPVDESVTRTMEMYLSASNSSQEDPWPSRIEDSMETEVGHEIAFAEETYRNSKAYQIVKGIRPILFRSHEDASSSIFYLWKASSSGSKRKIPVLCPWWATTGLHMPTLCTVIDKTSLYENDQFYAFDPFEMYHFPPVVAGLPSIGDVAKNVRRTEDGLFRNRRREWRAFVPIAHPTFCAIRHTDSSVEDHFVLKTYKANEMNLTKYKHNGQYYVRTMVTFVLSCTYDPTEHLHSCIRYALRRQQHNGPDTLKITTPIHTTNGIYHTYQSIIYYKVARSATFVRSKPAFAHIETPLSLFEKCVFSVCVDIAVHAQIWRSDTGVLKVPIDVQWSPEETAYNTFVVVGAPRVEPSSIHAVSTRASRSMHAYAAGHTLENQEEQPFSRKMVQQGDKIERHFTPNEKLQKAEPESFCCLFSQTLSDHLEQTERQPLPPHMAHVAKAASFNIRTRMTEADLHRSVLYKDHRERLYVCKEHRMQCKTEMIYELASYTFWYLYSTCFNERSDACDTQDSSCPSRFGIPMAPYQYAWYKNEKTHRKTHGLWLHRAESAELVPSVAELKKICEDIMKVGFSTGKVVVNGRAELASIGTYDIQQIEQFINTKNASCNDIRTPGNVFAVDSTRTRMGDKASRDGEEQAFIRPVVAPFGCQLQSGVTQTRQTQLGGGMQTDQ